MSEEERDTQHLPAPSLWPIGFAIGVACILVVLVVSVPALIVGAAIALVFGFLWVRDLFTEHPVTAAAPVCPTWRRQRPRPTWGRTSTARPSSPSRPSASAR